MNGNCAHAYIGGKFTSINGTAVQNVAEIDTTTGNVVAGFGTKASGAGADHGRRGQSPAGRRQLHGVNGDTADPYMASLSPNRHTTGFCNLGISGNYITRG